MVAIRFQRNSDRWQSSGQGNFSIVLADQGERIGLPAFLSPFASTTIRAVPCAFAGSVDYFGSVIDGNTYGLDVTVTAEVNAVAAVPAFVLTITAGVNGTFSQSGIEFTFDLDDLLTGICGLDAGEAGTSTMRVNTVGGRAS